MFLYDLIIAPAKAHTTLYTLNHSPKLHMTCVCLFVGISAFVCVCVCVREREREREREMVSIQDQKWHLANMPHVKIIAASI
jgi:hypothetical protein